MNYKQTVFEKLIDKRIASDNFLSDTHIDILKMVAIKVANAYEELAESSNISKLELLTVHGNQYYPVKQAACNGCAFSYTSPEHGGCSIPKNLAHICIDKNIVWKPYVA